MVTLDLDQDQIFIGFEHIFCGIGLGIGQCEWTITVDQYTGVTWESATIIPTMVISTRYEQYTTAAFNVWR